MASGEYKEVLNGVKAAMENRACKERASRNVASNAMTARTTRSSGSNRSNGGDHRESSDRFFPGPTEAVELGVATIVTAGVGIAKTVDTLGTDETITAAIITAIIWIMAGVMMTAVATAGMTTEVIKIFAMEVATAVVDIGDMPIT